VCVKKGEKMKKVFALGLMLGIVAIYGANAELVVSTTENEQVVVDSVVTDSGDVTDAALAEDAAPVETAVPTEPVVVTEEESVAPVENPEPAEVVETVEEETVSE
jgi:hypothetical protein